MANNEIRGNYQQRLDQQLSELVDKWWNTLSKEDLLEYIRDTRSITADQLRTLFRNENVHLRANFLFMTSNNQAQMDFNGNPNAEPYTGPVEE